MITMLEKEHCTGCSACAVACPKHCVSMRPDKEGFLYPSVDEAACVDCGLCDAVCGGPEAERNDTAAPAAYAAQALDEELRMASSSGGVFSLLARRVSRTGGAVYGAALAADCRVVRHAIAEDEAGLSRLRGSKYLQSELGSTFQNVRSALARGREVLFTGTPCQIDGLKRFLGQEFDGLLCAEVVCHGVPSPRVWQAYLEYLEKKAGAPVREASFREKSKGWKAYQVRFGYGAGSICRPFENDPYMRMFLHNDCLRPSCYCCPSKGLDRKADLTIGDFWGIQDVAPEMDDDTGTSLVLVHTEKGRQALDDIRNAVRCRQVDCTAALQGNQAAMDSVKRPAERDTFFTDLYAMPFSKLRQKYVPVTRMERLKRFVRRAGLLPLARRAVGWAIKR